MPKATSTLLAAGLALGLSLCACTDAPEKPSPPPSGAQRGVQAQRDAPLAQKAPSTAEQIVRQIPPPEPEKPTAAQLASADQILAWNNKVQNILARGALADKVATCAELYLETWRLPRRPRGYLVRDFAPTPGLIKGESAKHIDSLLASMNKASDDMVATYNKLEKYVQDPLIQDDGKLGRELAAQVARFYEQYLTARRSFLAIVEEKTGAAEDLLLTDHPLRRQIRQAQGIFASFREISELLASGSPDMEQLMAREESLRNLITAAGKPPFLASPAYERLYRHFLKLASAYVQVLQRGMEEGFHSVQKRELLDALHSAREGYNEFARAINEGN